MLSVLRKSQDELQKKTGAFVGTVIVGALAAFCEGEVSTGIRSFFTAHKVPDAERTLQQTLERIDACARFVKDQRPNLEAWLATGANR